MTMPRMLALVLAVVLLVTVATPAPAEAVEIGTVLLIAGAVVVVVIIIGFLVVANVSERRTTVDATDERVIVVALDPRPLEMQ